MRNKSLFTISSMAVFFIILMSSCQKFNTVKENNTNQEIALKDANFSPEFDWKTTRNITLLISSTNAQIVSITSMDNLIKYHKGMFLNKAETYVVKISVPKHIDKLKINEQEFDLISDNISINL